MKKFRVLIILVCFMLLILTVTANADTGVKTFSMEKAYGYTSNDYKLYLFGLVKKYPEILQLEEIGKSADTKPIYAVRMSAGFTPEDNVNKYNILIESGTHAREIINPAVICNIIEDYCLDYYNDKYLPDLEVKKELTDSVLHFIVLTNPDGHDLVKYGKKTLKNQNLLSWFKGNDAALKRLKGNAKGVDINRNFVDTYYDYKDNKWVAWWGYQHPTLKSLKPSIEFYGGTSGGSEPETQAVQEYIDRYDFRVALSYHSSGRVVYYDKVAMPKDINDLSLAYARIAGSTTGYRVIPPSTKLTQEGSGYFTRYFAYNKYKPALTVETTATMQPSNKTDFKVEYAKYKLNKLPILFLKEAKRVGYFKYKLYDKNGIYVTDFMTEVYAKAMAVKTGGEVIVYDGKPYMQKKVEPTPIPEPIPVPAPAPIEDSQPTAVPMPLPVPTPIPAPTELPKTEELL